jgi:hypothetical protein
MNELSTSPGGARGPGPFRALFSLTILALAACGGNSSGGTQGDALGQAGATGTGGAGSGGVGPGSGSPATDASVPSGGGGVSGGYGGSGGAGGGTPSPCPDPKYPASCPARNDVPSICWSAGTICSTIAKCGDQFFSCTTPGAHYDCAEMRCVYDSSGDGGAAVECGDPAFPVSCPAIGDVPKLCWSSGTVCSSLIRCGTEFKSCLASGYRYDCATFKCVPGSNVPVDAASTAPDAGASVDAAAGDAGPTDALTADSGG